MQAAPVRSTTLPSVAAALRAVESLLMNAGQRTARRNAWTCVLQDRRRAQDRAETQQALAGRWGRHTDVQSPGEESPGRR